MADKFDNCPVGNRNPATVTRSRLLDRVGSPGGAKDYVVNGKMTGGFAFVAYPAEYGNSGVMTFMINQDGVLLQKDLGKSTTETATAMSVFDPDAGWIIVEQ